MSLQIRPKLLLLAAGKNDMTNRYFNYTKDLPVVTVEQIVEFRKFSLSMAEALDKIKEAYQNTQYLELTEELREALDSI